MKVVLEGKRIVTQEEFHAQIAAVLELPDYYGKNLDALWDCLTGWIDKPTTIVWKDFEVVSDPVVYEQAASPA